MIRIILMAVLGVLSGVSGVYIFIRAITCFGVNMRLWGVFYLFEALCLIAVMFMMFALIKKIIKNWKGRDLKTSLDELEKNFE